MSKIKDFEWVEILKLGKWVLMIKYFMDVLKLKNRFVSMSKITKYSATTV
jgi:hypothetical protein